MPLKINGEKVDALHTAGDLWVTVELNQEQAAKAANEGKKAPEHYQKVSGPSVTFSNAVIVQEHSLIQFTIRSRGKFGFGYRIIGGLRLGQDNKVIGETKPDMIVSQLYCLPAASSENIFEIDPKADLYDVVQRYQSAAMPMISVEGFRTLGWSADDKSNIVAMMNCTVSSWGVYGFIDGATDIDYGQPADIGQVEWGDPANRKVMDSVPSALLRSASAASAPSLHMATANASSPQPFNVAGGGPVRRGTSTQVFKSARLIREDNPDLAPNYVNFAFLIERP